MTLVFIGKDFIRLTDFLEFDIRRLSLVFGYLIRVVLQCSLHAFVSKFRTSALRQELTLWYAFLISLELAVFEIPKISICC